MPVRDTQQKVIRDKAYAYIVHSFCNREHILVFRHLDFPEAGIQIPGGTVEPGEPVQAAVTREAHEETGLSNLQIARKLGLVKRDMQTFGLNEIHHRHYFHLSLTSDPQATWIAYEETPSDGSEGPIAFRFFWVPLDQVPTLAGDLDESLAVLRQSLNQ